MADTRKPNKLVLAAFAIAHIAITTLTWRDLRNRPATHVRGSKTFWRVLSAVNILGSAGYWVLARRPKRRSILGG